MEELKLLVTMVADLPSMALWVIAFFFAYKTIIIGSIYGVIRLGIVKLHDVLVTRKTIIQEIILEDKLRGICITSDQTLNLLLLQLQRIKGKNTGIYRDEPHSGSIFIHERSVDWLREAINDKEAKDRAKGGV